MLLLYFFYTCSVRLNSQTMVSVIKQVPVSQFKRTQDFHIEIVQLFDMRVFKIILTLMHEMCLEVVSLKSLKTCKRFNKNSKVISYQSKKQTNTFNAFAKIAHRRRATFFFSLPNCKTSSKSTLQLELNAKMSLDWSIDQYNTFN